MILEIWKTWRSYAVLFIAGAVLCAAFILNLPKPSPSETPQPLATFPPAFSLDPQTIKGDAAVVYDPETGRLLYQKNARVPLPLASLTKLMSADVVLASEKPEREVLVPAEAASEINDPGDLGIKAGQRWSIAELVRYGLYASSNNAMLAAAAAIDGSTSTVAAMNAYAKEIGLGESQFYNPTGLDVNASLAGGYGSARDVALLAADFYQKHPSYFEGTVQPGSTFGPPGDAVDSEPTAAPIADIPGVLAAKTGYTDLAMGNMVAVFDVEMGHPLVAVVLHSSEEGRFSDIRTLIAAARAAAEYASN